MILLVEFDRTVFCFENSGELRFKSCFFQEKRWFFIRWTFAISYKQECKLQNCSVAINFGNSLAFATLRFYHSFGLKRSLWISQLRGGESSVIQPMHPKRVDVWKSWGTSRSSSIFGLCVVGWLFSLWLAPWRHIGKRWVFLFEKKELLAV